MNKKPNKYLAPIVIAGVTVGFLASAYKFIFAKPKTVKPQNETQTEPTHIESETDNAP